MSESSHLAEVEAGSEPTTPPVEPVRAPPAGALLEVRELSKAFGPTRALRSCSLQLRAGEVHALVGENGSGKSTLVKILSGVHRPDAGEVLIGGAPSRRRPSPRAAQRSGVITVFQEVLVVGSQSVLENVWLGVDGLFAHRLSLAEKRRRALQALGELLDSPPRLDAVAETLSLSDRQACCIARAFVREGPVLILDESTSALDVETRDRLFAAIRRRQQAGIGVIFISHRMDEIRELADRVTVLRSGESVVTLDRDEADTETLVRHMTGAEHLAAGVATRSRAERAGRDVILRTEALRLHPGAEPIDVEVRAAELVGLAGLEGHGQDAFLQALRGAGAHDGRVLAGEGAGTGAGDVVSDPRDALRNGIVYVPRDRRSESLFPTLSVEENFALPTLAADRQAMLVRWGGVRRRLAEYVEQLSIRLGNPRQPIAALSGGNQQKVIIARWLAAHPRVLLLNDPTRGVDLGAKRDLYRVLEALVDEGVAVVMLSTEVDELVELMDRVLVFREGSLSSALDRERLSRTALVSAFFGESS